MIDSISAGTTVEKSISSSWTPVSSGTTISYGDTIRWQAAANASGTLPAFSVKVQDAQGALSSAVQVYITVTPVNDLPTLSTISTLTGGVEDTFLVITYSDLANAADEFDAETPFPDFRIESVTASTTLEKWDGSAWNAVTAGTTLISSGDKVQWKAAANDSGLARPAFTVKVRDSNSALSSAVQVNVDVAAVNDAPAINGITSGVTSLNFAENGAAQSQSFTLSDPDNSVTCASVTTNSNNITLVPNGNLTISTVSGFTNCSISVVPAANQSGSAVITLTLDDSSGAANAVTTKTFTVNVTDTHSVPTLAGGDSLVIHTETAGGGNVNIALAVASANPSSPASSLVYKLIQGPQPQTGKSLVNGALGSLTFASSPVLPAGTFGDARASGQQLTYTLNADVYAGFSDQISYQVCQAAYPTMCSDIKSVSIAVIAVDDPSTITSLTIDSNTPPLKLTGAAQTSKTFAMTFTLTDSDSAVNCNGITATSSNTAVFPVPTINGGTTTSCFFNLISANGASGDSDIQLKIGTTALRLNGTSETSFRATVLALNGSNNAVHLCTGASLQVEKGPSNTQVTVNGAAVCVDYAASGWDATASLDATKFYRSVDTAKLPEPRKYCTGIKIFGYQGMAYCGEGKDPLNLHRNVGTLALNTSTAPSADYRLFPDPAKDHDAQTVGSSGVSKLTTRPSVVCGSSGTLASRIANCATQNPTTSYWDGSANANAGQGLWRLVTVKPLSGSDCTSGCTEVWRDERTGLLWGDVMEDNSGTPVTDWNWCKASGKSNAASNPPSKEDETGLRCSDATYQGQAATGANMPVSLCVDNAAFKALDSRQSLARGDLNLTSTPAIRWWLPTRSDWLRAERNGLRFVLPNMSNEFWTATVDSATPANAWTFDGASGGKLNSVSRIVDKKVRCVGSP